MDESLPRIFDRAIYLERQAKAASELVKLVHDHVAGDLAERLGVINHEFARVLLWAPAAEPFLSELLQSGKCGTIDHQAPAKDDTLDLKPAIYDAVFHLLDLQTVNDVPGQLAQFARALKPDGLFLTCFFAGETLHELRSAWLAAETAVRSGVSPRVAPMIGLQELGGLLQRAGLALPVADSETLTLRYGEALKLMSEIKAAGFSNPLEGRSRGLTSMELVSHVITHYATDYADADGRLRATLELAWGLAWKPHDSQQKPLKPGSAAMRLADVLKSEPN